MPVTLTDDQKDRLFDSELDKSHIEEIERGASSGEIVECVAKNAARLTEGLVMDPEEVVKLAIHGKSVQVIEGFAENLQLLWDGLDLDNNGSDRVDYKEFLYIAFLPEYEQFAEVLPLATKVQTARGELKDALEGTAKKVKELSGEHGVEEEEKRQVGIVPITGEDSTALADLIAGNLAPGGASKGSGRGGSIERGAGDD